MIGYNTNGINGLSLEYGTYELTIIESNFNKNVNKNFQLCSNFSLLVLLENRPYDHFSKGISQNPISCPYMFIPESFSFPGLISPDTNFSINEYLRYKLSDKEQYTKFLIHSKSLFKLYIPKLNNNVFAYVKLMKETKGKRKKIIEKPEAEEIDINLLLEKKGTYTIELYFKGSDDSNLVEAKGCKYYDLYLNVMPIENLTQNLENFTNCNESVPSNLSPNSEHSYTQITINKRHDQNNIKEIKILPANKPSKFLAEVIYNSFIDTPYRFSIMKNEKNKDPTEVPADIIYNENFVWVIFNVEKEVDYSLQLTSTVFHSDLNICSNLYLSHSYHSEEEEEKIQDGTTIEKEQTIKEDCRVNDHLPSSFYKEEKNNLEKYGGSQGKDGLFKFLGEFLIPVDDTNKRASFIISKKSILYVKFNPNYEKYSNIFIQVFRDRNLMYRYGHNEINGVMMIELGESDEPYYLDFIFDKTQSYNKCDTFELIVNIIPLDLYISEYITCEEEISHIPEKINIQNSKDYTYLNFFKLGNKDLKFNEDNDKNMVFETVLSINKSFALTVQYTLKLD